jgi:macrolide transport system ATP-binding/permease protein
METLLQDLRYGARTLVHSPGFTAVAVVSLALGIGANATIFSLVNAILFRPLPVERPHELVDLYTSDFSGPYYGSSSYPDIVDFRARNDAFSSLAAFSMMPMNLSGSGGTERVWGLVVTGEYFPALGLRPAAGRLLGPEDDNERRAEAVAVISHGYWMRRFAADPGVVGRTIVLNGHPFTIAGVAPRGFTGTMNLFSFDVWTPMMMQEALQPGRSDALDNRSSRWLLAFGRLKKGVTLDRARASFAGIARQLHEEHPRSWTDVRKQPRRITLEPASGNPMLAGNRGAVLGVMTLLMLVVGGVLLIACANVASMLMARATARAREMGIRLSMGAARSRLVRQLLTESALLAILGGGAALLLTLWTTSMLSRLQPPVPFPVEMNLGLDWRVLAFAAAVSLATAVLFGLAPALATSQTNPLNALRASEIGGRGRGWVRRGIVIAQFAASCLLLIGSGLFVRSLMNAQSIDVGFRNRDILLAGTDLALQGYDETRGRLFQRQLLDEVRAVAGVRDATLADVMPLGPGQRKWVGFEGYQPRPGEDMEIHFSKVGAGYFRLMGIDVVRGRAFTEDDRAGAMPVVMVSEALARRYWPGKDPIGKRITRGRVASEVVGVVRDGKYVSLAEEPRPYFYLPLAQNYDPSTILVVATSGRPKDALGAVSAALRKLDKDLPLTDVKSMDEHLAFSLLPARLIGWLLGIFGGVALALAVVGVYGLMSYSVSRRTREVGVRIALGARPAGVLAMILKQGMRVAAAGLAIGTLAAFALTRFAAALLYDVSPTDAPAFLAAIALLAASALAACYLPARRAAGVDPLRALRWE